MALVESLGEFWVGFASWEKDFVSAHGWLGDADCGDLFDSSFGYSFICGLRGFA